jgi:uncharacterized delta-60 repeat protein
MVIHVPFRCALAAVVTAFVMSPACASPALDPTFGEGGRVWVAPTYVGSLTTDAYVVIRFDGSIVTTGDGRLYRYRADGTKDEGFGYGQGGIANGDLGDGLALGSHGRPVAMPDGSIRIPVIGVPAAGTRRVGVVKLLPDGKRDPAFGTAGVAFAAGTPEPGMIRDEYEVAGAAVEPDGRVVVAAFRRDGQVQRLTLARFTPDGQPDETFDVGGRRALDQIVLPGSRMASRQDGQFALLVSYRDGRFGVAKFRPGGEPDTVFGTVKPIPPNPLGLDPWPTGAVAIAADGSLVAAIGLWGSYIGDDGYAEVFARFGADGRTDESFGSGGSIVLSSVDGGAIGFANDGLAIDVAGGIVVLGGAASVHRLTRSGMPDSRYSNEGVAQIREPYFAFANAIALAPDGKVVMGADVLQAELADPRERRQALYRVRGNWEGRSGDTTVVEYFNSAFGHYFITSMADEQSKLDAGSDWKRTGRSFRAWSSQAEDLSAMCRFFSQATFAPKSTHFLSPFRAECDSVRKRPEWWYEGPTFSVRLPEGLAGFRGCPAGNVPLYRVYNNTMGGAPNHRYTTDAAVLDQMIAQGWTMEGDGITRVFACVASQ